MALETITEINLDVNQPGLEVVHAKQYDTVRKVKAHLFYNGVKWLVPSFNYTAVVAFKKADRIGGFYDTTESGEAAISVDSNDRSIITILLDRNTVTTPGNCNVEITFYATTSSGRLSTFSFVLRVEEASVTELDLSSNPYFNVLASDIALVLNAEQSLSGISVSASALPEGSSPTVNVEGGPTVSEPYSFNFGIPRGNTGSAGPAGVAVQTTEPTNGIKFWINPNESRIITIPDASECNPLHLSGTISSFPYTINDGRLTSQMRVINCVFGSPENVLSDVTWSTETTGKIILNGALKTNTTTTVDLDVQTCIT